MKRLFLIVIALAVSQLAVAADAPQWAGHYVNDYANILDNDNTLESMLIELERNTSIEFAIVTLSSIPADETKETYSYKIFNEWGLGKEDKDNGLLFLMIANGTPGNRMRIEVGYGLEGDLPDSAAGRILDAALPHYENGDYSQAAYTVVNGIKDRLKGKYLPAEDSEEYASIAMMVLGMLAFPIIMGLVFLIIAVSVSGRKCPRCGSLKVKCEKENCVCKKCGFRFRKKKRASNYAWVAGTGGWGGGGFGGGGFGGGSSGGGGAGR